MCARGEKKMEGWERYLNITVKSISAGYECEFDFQLFSEARNAMFRCQWYTKHLSPVGYTTTRSTNVTYSGSYSTVQYSTVC